MAKQPGTNGFYDVAQSGYDNEAAMAAAAGQAGAATAQAELPPTAPAFGSWNRDVQNQNRSIQRDAEQIQNLAANAPTFQEYLKKGPGTLETLMRRRDTPSRTLANRVLFQLEREFLHDMPNRDPRQQAFDNKVKLTELGIRADEARSRSENRDIMNQYRYDNMAAQDRRFQAGLEAKFSKLLPSQRRFFTPESLARFDASGNAGDLVPNSNEGRAAKAAALYPQLSAQFDPMSWQDAVVNAKPDGSPDWSRLKPRPPKQAAQATPEQRTAAIMKATGTETIFDAMNVLDTRYEKMVAAAEKATDPAMKRKLQNRVRLFEKTYGEELGLDPTDLKDEPPPPPPPAKDAQGKTDKPKSVTKEQFGKAVSFYMTKNKVDQATAEAAIRGIIKNQGMVVE